MMFSSGTPLQEKIRESTLTPPEVRRGLRDKLLKLGLSSPKKTRSKSDENGGLLGRFFGGGGLFKQWRTSGC